MTTTAGRIPGSVRFDPYYKVQVWRDDVGGAWVDIQRPHASLDDAIAAIPAGRRGRVMRIAMDGREVVWEGED